jgi:integrase
MSKSSAPLPCPPSDTLEEARAAAAEYARGSHAASTRHAYESDWQIFSVWCASVGLTALPAEASTLALFLAAQGRLGHAPSTLDRRRSAIRLKHREAHLPSPHDAVEVERVLRGIRNAWGRPRNQKSPTVDAEVQQMADATDPKTLQGLRDRALVLLGFTGAFRRSELVALDVAHLVEVPEGFLVRIATSKTDQAGEGQTIAIGRVPGSPYCPVQAVSAWRRVADIHSGALFRRVRKGDVVGEARLTPQSVALVVKRMCQRVGLDPSLYAGHSLRRGFLTSAARARASIFKMADHSRHKSLDVLRTYVQDAERFEDHAGNGLLHPKAVR